MKCKRIINQDTGESCRNKADFEVIALIDGTTITACAIHFIELCEDMQKQGEPLILAFNN